MLEFTVLLDIHHGPKAGRTKMLKLKNVHSTTLKVACLWSRLTIQSFEV